MREHCPFITEMTRSSPHIYHSMVPAAVKRTFSRLRKIRVRRRRNRQVCVKSERLKLYPSQASKRDDEESKAVSNFVSGMRRPVGCEQRLCTDEKSSVSSARTTTVDDDGRGRWDAAQAETKECGQAAVFEPFFFCGERGEQFRFDDKSDAPGKADEILHRCGVRLVVFSPAGQRSASRRPSPAFDRGRRGSVHEKSRDVSNFGVFVGRSGSGTVWMRRHVAAEL